jgi:putative DNA primase/helicase
VTASALQIGPTVEAGERLTDAGNACRFAAQHAGGLCFIHGLGWQEYDGKRWARDTTGAVARAAKETVRSLYTEAGEVDDADERKAIGGWAVRSEGEPRIRALVALAQSEIDIVHGAHELDVDPFLLNVENGTLDLRTGRLRPHDPADMITKLAPVAYRADADDPILERFLWEIFGDRPEDAPHLLTYLQRAVGYMLTGDTSEEKLLFVHGPTNTGKSTLLEAIKAMLGDYARTADFETFLKRKSDGGVRNDIARLAGARVVASLEVEEGKKLAEGLIKSLTGKDTVSARFLYNESFEFQPQFKLVLAANARPRVNAADGAMWRRIDCLPFTNTIPEAKRDKGLKKHLISDPGARSALLAWAVQGCELWQQHGLATPDAVKAYTDDYRQENDSIGEWIADRCRLAADASATSAELHSSHSHWAEHRREHPYSARSFAAVLRTRGFTSTHTMRGNVWQGIRLRGDDG